MRSSSFLLVLTTLFVLSGAGLATPGGAVPLEMLDEPGAGKIAPRLLADMEASALGQEQGGGPLTLHRVVVSLRAPGNAPHVGTALGSEHGARRLAKSIETQTARALTETVPGALELRTVYQSIYGFSAHADAEALLALVARPEVVSVEPFPEVRYFDAVAHRLTSTEPVHQMGFTGDGVTIAVIDDAFDYRHAAFGGHSGFPNARVLGGWDFFDNDPDPLYDCPAQSHGTGTAGIAAANGGGLRGAAPNANLVLLKMSGCSNGQRSGFGDFVGALDWVAANARTFGIKVLSMSLGIDGPFASKGMCNQAQPAIKRAIDAIQSAGVAIFASAGNSGSSDRLFLPACMSKVTSVGAVFDKDVGARNYGSCSHAQTFADLVICYSDSAPFLDLLAPSECARTAQVGGGRITCFGGTSAASPYAAGVAASLYEANRSLSNPQMRALLKDNGVPITDPKSGVTAARVDALASLAALTDVEPPTVGPPPPPPNPDPTPTTDLLENGVARRELTGGAGEELRFRVRLPVGATNLRIRLAGGTGNADLYVKARARPTTSDFDCAPRANGNGELCRDETPLAGTWHILVRGASAFAGTRVIAKYDTP